MIFTRPGKCRYGIGLPSHIVPLGAVVVCCSVHAVVEKRKRAPET